MKTVLILLAGVFLPIGLSGAFAQSNSGGIIGTPWVGAKGITESVSEIMARQRIAGDEEGEAEETEAEKIWPDRRGLPQNPAAKDHSQWPVSKEAQPPISPLSPQTLGVSLTAATLSGINPTNAFPPDDMGAVGPTQYIIAVNGRIVTFNKTTGLADGAINVTTNSFFTSVRNGSGTSDPRIRFDRLTGRWFIIIINVSTPNRVLIAVSNVGTITSSANFTFFFFLQSAVSPAGDATCLTDYPTVGIDVNAMYIGGNQFCPSYSGTVAFVVQKSSVLGAGPIVVSAFRNLTGSPSGPGPFTPQGVDNHDPTATEGYIIGVDNSSFGTLMLRRVSNPGGTPTLSGNISLATPLSTSNPIDVRHQGNTNEGLVTHNGRLDALDDRLFAAHYRNGRLWTAHNVGVNNTGSASGTASRNGSRWYELQGIASPGTPSVVQSGTVFAASASNTTDQRNYWIPSIMVSGQGHAAMVFSTAGTNEFANAATVGRLSGDAPGTMQTPLLYTSSSTAYNPSDPGNSRPRRWGDYTYVSLDPNDDMTMWAVSQFCDVTNSYGCRVIQLIAPPPATPASASPPSVAAGQSSVNVTVTGTQVSGSGFFDPGAGFANRISSAVSGGVVVNSITNVNPTTVTLNLNTVGASVGAKDITVTNPDGQNSVGSGILSITSSGPSITVTVPNGGESWAIGSSQNITWTSSGVSGNVKVELSTNGGTTFPTVLFASIANDGTESWTVSGPASTTARVRISSVTDGSIRDSSNANFSLVQPSITVTIPNGGESWAIGSSQNITWTSSNVSGSVRIELSTNGGTTFPTVIAASTANDGTEAWTVSGPVSSTARIRISSLSIPSVIDTSNGNFNMVQPSITVSVPNGGESWLVGSGQTITWTSANVPGSVKIELSTNGGTTFPTTLFASTANDGAEGWTVTGPGTSTGRVRISSVSIPSVADTSNANFIINQPLITVMTPNGGQTWGIGTEQTIVWSSSGVSGPVKVELTRNGGGSYEVLFASTADDGSEQWTVTGPPTTNALVRVSSISSPTVVDVSNGPFTISASFVLLTKLILRDNGGETDSLEFGVAPGATDGIDAVFGEYEQPPLPPLGVFDVRWSIAGTQGTKRDVRDTLGGMRQQIIYTGKLQPGGGGYPFVVKWNRQELPSGTFTLRDGPSGFYFMLNMKQQDSLVISDETVQQFQLVYDVGNTVYSSVQAGWSIVSIPVTVGNLAKTSVFPTSVSDAFAFTPGGYENRDTLAYGVGYWLKFGSNQTLSVSGDLMTLDTIDVIQGWNIIGSISSSVPVGSIEQIPGGIVASQYYDFTGGTYVPSLSINPMRGYWVKVTQNGKLVLMAGSFVRPGNNASHSR